MNSVRGKYLVTGAAGFIGSNLIDALLKDGNEVVGVDNFITGKRKNIKPFLSSIQFIEGDIRDIKTCRDVCNGVDYVLHQAALGSVPRSIEDPISSNEHNITGTLNMLVSAKEAKVKRFVYASSSSVYGDTEILPKVETMNTNPLSPYAVSKYVSELYGKLFWSIYGLPTIGLRYFNVFGRNQDPDGMYAAVIPRFIKKILSGESPEIFGDGEQTRDFTYIDNVIQANLRACQANEEAFGEVMNIGAGGRISINELTSKILSLLDSNILPKNVSARDGDVRDSQANIEKARKLIGYKPEISALEGLERAIAWYQKILNPT